MRQIILDTETTGLDPKRGHRIIEIGCIEMINRRLTRRQFHFYINPERDIDEGARKVHGISSEFLSDKPTFAQIKDEFIEFVKGGELIIHNAPFDVGFLNYEFRRLGKSCGRIQDYCKIIDTLTLAREMHPGQKNSLDALTKRYEISNFNRELHGALLDSEILAQVYLAMTSGQSSFFGDPTKVSHASSDLIEIRRIDSKRAPIPVICASKEELSAHKVKLAALSEASGTEIDW